jgi:sortase A
MKFVFYPIILSVIVIAALTAAILPVAMPYAKMMDVFFLDKAPQFDEGHIASAVPEGATAAIPNEGAEYGTVLIDSVDIDAPLYYGDTPGELLKGIGTYTGAYIPGKGHTVLLAGHNNTFFNSLGKVKIGDRVVIETDYGEFSYEVAAKKEITAADTSAFDLEQEEENLILYTCTNDTVFGTSENRTLVFARYLADE